ncbi:MAG TPA: ubiquinol-cytochrome c reductase iron-sulfur subunit [Pseudonocardiaceae bacterium]|jgi:ubiquinol-cytochrome c reductase iron-sulfur subunit|nr:ubiquinol-cytochrome c reductase iron-sulfur subunit [Pseudonocardiaceae bacterium]
MSAHGEDSAKQRGTEEPDVSAMSRDELVRLGSALDDVEIVERKDPFPVPGTRAEKRTERQVAAWFAIAGLCGLAFLGFFLFWPWEYAPPGAAGEQHILYQLYTPLVGFFSGMSILAIGIGAISYAKHLLPHETAVQQRHDGRSSEVDRQTLTAILSDTGERSHIGRRSLIKRTAGFGAGAFGLGLGAYTLGGLLRNPWKGGDDAELWTTGWTSHDNERVYLRRSTGEPHDVALVKAEDLAAGTIETVFPFRESERDDDEALSEALRESDNPVMLIRLRPEQAARVVKRKGQEDFNYGDYYAFTKICSHLGCPASLYESQTARILCPCHQSQFDALQYAKPIFGPATRSLAQLPLAVDDEGYFYARHGFIEAVGPGFWERKS